MANAIKRLVGIAQGIPDGELDRPWRWRDCDSEGIRFAFFRTYEELRELGVKLHQERIAAGIPQSSA